MDIDFITKLEGELIPGRTVKTVNAREVWSFLESKRQFADWIKYHIKRFRFVEGRDYFVTICVNSPLGGRPTVDFHVTVEMAKHLAMVQRNRKGHAVRKYFIERDMELGAMEASVPRNPLVCGWDPRDPASLRKMAAALSESFAEPQIPLLITQSSDHETVVVSSCNPAKIETDDQIAHPADHPVCVQKVPRRRPWIQGM